MTNEEILKKAIERAIDNGWKEGKEIWFVGDSPFKQLDGDNFVPHEEVIFNHNFAKAFFGEDIKKGICGEEKEEPWKYHLQRLVLESDPIKYLERFI